jgi:formylglycine-generating enzyme required for sulfatase activity
MGGNVEEWTATEFSYSMADISVACSPGNWCVYRGRGWAAGYPGGTTERWRQRSTYRADLIGFRCAR